MTKREVVRTVLNHQQPGLQMGPALWHEFIYRCCPQTAGPISFCAPPAMGSRRPFPPPGCGTLAADSQSSSCVWEEYGQRHPPRCDPRTQVRPGCRDTTGQATATVMSFHPEAAKASAISRLEAVIAVTPKGGNSSPIVAD